MEKTKVDCTKDSPSEKLQRIDIPLCNEFLSTGCTILDLAIANQLPGGFGVGCISHIYGVPSSGKTILLAETLGSAQRKGGIAYFGDAERTLDFQRAFNLYGVDINNEKLWQYDQPTSIEDLFDRCLEEILKKRTKRSKPGALGVDSLSALPSEAERKGNLKDTGYGVTRARQFSTAFRKRLQDLSDKKLSVIFVDQTRQNIGIAFGDRHTTSGGEAIKFYSSTRVLCTDGGKIKNAAGKAVGVIVKFLVKKNKIGPPFRDGKFRILFDYGIDDIGSNLEWMKDNISSDIDWINYGDGWCQEMSDLAVCENLEEAIAHVEEKGLEEELRKAVENRWKEVYKPLNRKPRRRS